MSIRCVACRKPTKRGQLFCPDCLEKRAPASARKQERRRLGQLLEFVLSLPFLAVAKARARVITTEDAVWEDTRQKIRSDPEERVLFIKVAASLGIEPSTRVVASSDIASSTRAIVSSGAEPSIRAVASSDIESRAQFDALITNMDASTGMRIVREINTRRAQTSSRHKTDVFGVQRRLLALSSSLLSALVVALALLSLALLIIN